MIYTDLTKLAINIMFEAHKNQKDKSGLPYVFHPYTVASSLDDEYSVVTALLHDVVEDSDIEFSYLETQFPSQIIEALKLLTHDPSEDYFEYVKKIKNNPIAKRVKISDLNHNSDLSRLKNISEFDLKRLEKYKKALNILMED